MAGRLNDTEALVRQPIGHARPGQVLAERSVNPKTGECRTGLGFGCAPGFGASPDRVGDLQTARKYLCED